MLWRTRATPRSGFTEGCAVSVPRDAFGLCGASRAGRGDVGRRPDVRVCLAADALREAVLGLRLLRRAGAHPVRGLREHLIKTTGGLRRRNVAASSWPDARAIGRPRDQARERRRSPRCIPRPTPTTSWR